MHAHVTAKRIEGLAHEIDLGENRAIVVDEPVEDGGTDTGPRPSQLLASSLAGCTAITIELYAQRKGWDIAGLEVAVDMSSDGGPNPHASPNGQTALFTTSTRVTDLRLNRQTSL